MNRANTSSVFSCCSYVLAAATSTFFINTLHMVRTSQFRKLSGLKYPIPYATTEQAEKDPSAYKFNCGKSRILCVIWSCGLPSPRHAQHYYCWPPSIPLNHSLEKQVS
jgi:hypothetical protein